MPPINLEQAASEFAQEIQELLDAVLPGERRIKAVQYQERYVVRPEAEGLAADRIPLFVRKQQTAQLELSFRCAYDHQGAYLAVEQSQFTLYADPVRIPLLRFEFLRNPHACPAAHWQIHAERGAFSTLLARGRTRAPHDLASLHLPVGGPRMRPCLEDLLEFLVHDCKVDSRSGWRHAVTAGRERWRRRQVAALVRDAPEEVVRVLEENGSVVQRPDNGGLPGRPEPLRAW